MWSDLLRVCSRPEGRSCQLQIPIMTKSLRRSAERSRGCESWEQTRAEAFVSICVDVSSLFMTFCSHDFSCFAQFCQDFFFAHLQRDGLHGLPPSKSAFPLRTLYLFHASATTFSRVSCSFIEISSSFFFMFASRSLDRISRVTNVKGACCHSSQKIPVGETSTAISRHAQKAPISASPFRPLSSNAAIRSPGTNSKSTSVSEQKQAVKLLSHYPAGCVPTLPSLGREQPRQVYLS